MGQYSRGNRIYIIFQEISLHANGWARMASLNSPTQTAKDYLKNEIEGITLQLSARLLLSTSKIILGGIFLSVL